MSHLSLSGVSFAKLSVTDRNKLLQTFKEKSRSEKVRNAKDAGLAADQTWAELAVYDTHRWGYGQFCAMLETFDGQEAVLRAAAVKAEPGDVDARLSEITDEHEAILKFCCELTGVAYAPPKLVPPNMKQIGVVDGKPVYIAEDGKAPESADEKKQLAYGQEGGDEAHPTEPMPRKGYGT